MNFYIYLLNYGIEVYGINFHLVIDWLELTKGDN